MEMFSMVKMRWGWALVCGVQLIIWSQGKCEEGAGQNQPAVEAGYKTVIDPSAI